MSDVERHFDAIAPTYDSWKKRNWYYYQNLKAFFQRRIPAGKCVFDFGCGTGEVLAELKPRIGIGFDGSTEMIKHASAKFSKNTNLYFTDARSDSRFHDEPFDYIVCSDVIEHLEDVDGALRFMRQVASQKSIGIITMVTALWEPVLMVLEKLHMKMPEGPHHRISFRILQKKLQDAGFVIEERGTRLLVPTAAMPFANTINKYFYKIPLVRKLGLVGYVIVRPAGVSQ